jgi:hypothetical protein
MIEPLSSLVWFSLAGALGAVTHAARADNACWWPSRVVVEGRRRMARPGLLVNLAVGAGAAGGTSVLWSSSAATPFEWTALVGAVFVGWLAGRCLTGAADIRLLRAALGKACSAPAACAETAGAMARATPFDAYLAACELVPAVRWVAPHGGQGSDTGPGPRRTTPG